MADEKPLTKLELLAVLKVAGVVTKDDLKNFATKEDLKKLATKDDLKALEGKIDSLERRLKLRMGKHKMEILMAMAKLATTTPTRKEFEELKGKVDRLLAH